MTGPRPGEIKLMSKKMALCLLGMAAFGAAAQSVTDVRAKVDASAYIQDARGNVLRSGSGMCWRTGYWESGDAVEGCDGALSSPIAQPTAPALAPATASLVPAAPLAVTAPVPHCNSAIVLASDATFAFGKANLTARTRERLEAELRQRLASCSQLQAIKITGHTDRIGSARSNHDLSQKRAASIAAAATHAGVTVPIEVRGVGSESPLVFCNGKISNMKLIACLAPNRRATIEFDSEVK
jgi:OOP family OmpA-OmpF porin